MEIMLAAPILHRRSLPNNPIPNPNTPFMASLMNQINRYQIKDVLGGGGMARVYRAYDPRFKREVAIKVMAAHLLHDPQFRQRSSREAQVIASRKRRRLCQFDPSAGSGQALGSRMGT